MTKCTLATAVRNDLCKHFIHNHHLHNNNNANNKVNDEDKSEVVIPKSFNVFWPLVLDFLLGQLVLGPLITACWRGAWIGFNVALDDHVLRHASPLANTAACVFLGLVAVNALYRLCPVIRACALRAAESRVRFFVVSRAFTFLSFGSSMMLWKGWWQFCDLLTGSTWTGAAGLLMLAFPVMVIMGGTRSCIGFPLSLCVDDSDTYVNLTYYSTSWTKSKVSLGFRYRNRFLTFCLVAAEPFMSC